MVDLSLYLSAESLQEARLIADIENMLMNLQKENFLDVFNRIKTSVFITTVNRVKQLASHVIFAVSKRYMSIPLYSKLICDLYDIRSEQNQLSQLHSAFFPLIIPCNVDSRTLYFLYFCAVGSLFTDVDIVDVLRDSLKKEPDQITELLTLFCFFAPEVEEYDKPLFSKFIKAVIKEAGQPFCHSYVKQFGSELHDLCVDNWSLLKSRREAMKSGDKIIDSLFSDSVDEFQTIVSHSAHFDLNQNINESIFSPPHMFSKTLIQFAARCGSVKCFKYLLLNRADLRGTVDSAIIGGSNEIVRILKQHNCDFTGSLAAAAKAHRNAIFHWLEATDYPVCKDIQSNDIEAIFGAVEACNMPLILELLEKGIDINLQSHTGENIFSASITTPIDAFSLFVNHTDIDITKSMNGSSPLSTAVDRRNVGAVDFFFHQNRFDLRDRFKMENLIHIAAYQGDAEIMKIILNYPHTDVNSVNRVFYVY
ncbi:hypothetical protein TRFO_10162 [Tritrichomonas foetus]|uniref:DUF3447 domain-containing protein n=1 Tax=Tritrichomonas foetus TaxID=1144522 RepID=A0A1J4JEZ6_9EUKA|nr:hypothetical protein TRFO_10162 [Tritrichomonas foetus]|eukprot:OHS96211.1 hypothetical protein TRFO_10162 [Tritrichomonas foetus]